MEPDGSLPCSQEPSTGSYPEPDKPNSYRPTLCLEDPCNIKIDLKWNGVKVKLAHERAKWWAFLRTT
jgi:hypothetical protein